MKVHFWSRKVLGLRCRGVLTELGCRVAPSEDAAIAFSILGEHIFTAEEIERYPCGIVNLHLAPLPDYRGFYPFSHAIAKGEDAFAVTLHYVDEGIDTGPVIATREVTMADDPKTLADRAADAGFVLFDEWAPRLIGAARAGEKLRATPQVAGGHYYGRDSLAPNERF